jgi:hypothetical protein
LKRKYQRQEKEFPTMDDFLKLHKGGNAYGLFVTQFVRRVVGDAIWKKTASKKLISAFVTKSDEAFALLTIENQYERWSYMYENHDNADKERNAPPALYTNSGKIAGGRGTNRKHDGWSRDGLDRFNMLHELVTRDRARGSRVKFEEEIREEIKEEEMQRKIRRKAEMEDPLNDVYIAHDFEDVAGLPFKSSKPQADCCADSSEEGREKRAAEAEKGNESDDDHDSSDGEDNGHQSVEEHGSGGDDSGGDDEDDESN